MIWKKIRVPWGVIYKGIDEKMAAKRRLLWETKWEMINIIAIGRYGKAYDDLFEYQKETVRHCFKIHDREALECSFSGENANTRMQ